MFRLRLDQDPSLDNNSITKVVETLLEPFTELIVVHHVLPHGNPHIHAYAKTDLKEQCLRQRIKRYGFSASNFSLKKCDETRKDEYIQYLFNKKHGNISTILTTFNIDSQYLDKLQIQAQEYYDEYTNNKTAKRISRPTVSDYANEIHERIKEKYIRETVNDLQKTYPAAPEGFFLYKEYLELAIQVCNKYNQPFEEHYLRRLVSTAMCKTDFGKKTIIAKIMNKEFPN